MASKKKKLKAKKTKSTGKTGARKKTVKPARKRTVRKIQPKKVKAKKLQPKKRRAKNLQAKKVQSKKLQKKLPVKKAPPKKVQAKKKPVAKTPAAQTPVKKTSPGGLSEKLYDAALKVLKDRQAEQIVTVELEGRSSMADYMIVASGRASRQIAAIADYLRHAFMELGASGIRIEGLPEANWVVVDGGDVIVHLFRPEVRSYYRLEEIWDRKKPQK